MSDEIDYKFVVHYKTYPRFDKIQLDKEFHETPLVKLLNKRRTRRLPSKKELAIDLLHPLLVQAAGRTGKEENERDFRAYPSAGARYPLELYLFSFEVNGMKPGIYHFSPFDNSLEILLETDLKKDVTELFEEMDHDFLKDMKALIVISAIEERTTYKYGEPGKIFPFIEAGYLGANLILLLDDFGYNPITIGTQWCQKELESLLDLNPEKEKVISSVAIL